MDRRANPVSCLTDSSPSSLVVMKFGGSSVGSAARIEQVVRIVKEKVHAARPVVVVSAIGGVTDRLSQALEAMPTDNGVEHELIAFLYETHESIAGEVLSPSLYREYHDLLNDRLLDLRHDLKELQGWKKVARFGRDRVLSVGERLSAPLLAQALSSAGCPAEGIDASTLICTARKNGDVSVDLEQTHVAVRRWHERLDPQNIPIITGFIGGTADGEVTTLGRGGSDYSAALLARSLNASVLERWTDVDGLYTDDPRSHHDPERLTQLTFGEAVERTREGAFGMHPRTLDPLMDTRTKIHVRGTPTPQQIGTVIAHRHQEEI